MTQHLTVLAIDDDSGDAQILQRHLQQVPDLEIEFVHCADPARGREELSRRDVDLIFIDYQMGADTGLELLEGIRASGDMRPVIMLTGHGDEYIATCVTRAGADEYLVKSDLSPTVLRQAIACAVSQYNQRGLALRLATSHDKAIRQIDALSSELAQTSRADPLTQVLNRPALAEVAALEHQRARRYDNAYAVLLINIDHFKSYNDAQGRLMGDLGLQQVAGCIARALRSTDIVGRHGGEEFLAIMPETDRVTALAVADKIRAAVQQLALPHPDSPTADCLTVSIGVAALEADDDQAALFRRADESLYAAKNLGRNQACSNRTGAEPPASPVAPHRLTVLAIDDDHGDAEILRRQLEQIHTPGYNFLHALDHHSAAVILEAHRADVIFLDYTLGSANGIDVLRALRAAGEPLPIIAFTGQRNEYVATELMGAGADDYIVKAEANPETLRLAIESAIARRQRREFQVENRGLLRELRQTNAELRSKNARLADLCDTAHEFVDNVSHEFRTPLTVIKEFTSIILDGLAGETTPEQKEYLAIVLHRADDLATMIDDMLDISRLEAGVLAVARRLVQPAELLQRVRTTLERKAAAGGVRLVIDFSDDLPELYCDPEKIGRVLINLTVNAVKFSPAGSPIRLWAEHDAAEGVVHFGVTDRGPGIDPEQLCGLFERFKQLDGGIRSSTRGFGLGLNIAKELVQLNFGDIDVHSELGEGSTFTFTVPTSQPERLIARFLDRAAGFRTDAAYVALIDLRAPRGISSAMTHETERFIQHHIRRGDLLFPMQTTQWMLVAATSTTEVHALIERILAARADANRNRPGAPLPELTLEVAGIWNATSQREALIARFTECVAETGAAAELEPVQHG